MSDQLFLPLPDADAYLRRIGIEEAASSLTPDKDLLDRLIYAHQTHVPFENLDMCQLHVPSDLGIPALFDKVVTRRRGGYCFELNALFASLLEALHFDTRAVFCRIVNGHPDSEVRPSLHRGTLVKLDGVFHFCDVGYGGPMPAGSVPVIDGYSGPVCGEEFCMDRLTEFAGISSGVAHPQDDVYSWWRLSRRPDGPGSDKQKILEFNLFPQNNADFLPANMWCSSDMSLFKKRIIINLRTENGHRSITGDRLVIRDGDSCIEKEIENWDACRVLLKEYFDLSV